MRLIYLLLVFCFLMFQCDNGDEKVVCTPGEKMCQGNQVLQCDSDGQGQTIIEVCGEVYICVSGACASTIDAGQDAAVDAGQDVAAGPAVLTLDPASHDFGEVFINGRATKAFLVKNSGESTATAVSINPMIDDVFAIEVENTTCTSTSLTANSSCIITVIFHPTAEGPASGAVSLTYNSGVADETITGELSGTGKTGVILTISGNSDFGEQPVMGRVRRVFTVTPAGTISATDLSVRSLAAPFGVITTDCQGTLSGSCTITVQFAPENKEEAADTLAVYYHNGQEIVTAVIELSGQGADPYGWIGKTVSHQLVHPWSSDPITPENRAIDSTEPGAFHNIAGLAFDSAGNIYVLEGKIPGSGTENCRVQRFDSDGNPTGWIGYNGSGSVNTGWQMGNDPTCGDNLGFAYPIAVSQANGMLFILDDTEDGDFPWKIKQWDLAGNPVATYNLSAGDNDYFGMVISPSNYFYLSRSGSHRVERWHFSGSSLEYAGFIGGIATYHNTSVWRTPYNGTEYEETPLATGSAGAFYSPEDLVIDGQGVVYVTDTEMCRVTRLWANGSFAGSICNGVTEWDWHNCDSSVNPSSWANGSLTYPFALTLWNGSLLVTDTNHHRIKRFDSATGNFIETLGYDSGYGDGLFNYPKGITAGANGALFIADTDNFRVQKWLYNGTNDHFDYIGWIGYTGTDYQRNFISGGTGQWDSSLNKSGFRKPVGVAVDQTHLYVVDEKKISVQRFLLADPSQVEQLILTDDDDYLPQKIEVAASELYVTSTSEYSPYPGIVYFIDKTTFAITRIFDPDVIFGPIPVTQRVFNPHSIRVHNGLFYLAEYDYQGSNPYHARISRATLDLNTLIDWAGHYMHIVPTSGWTLNGDSGYGKLPGVFNSPKGLALDSAAGLLYVADYQNDRVKKFLLDGTFQSQVELTMVISIALADDAIFVTAGAEILQSIMKYDYNFTPLGSIPVDPWTDVLPLSGIVTSGNYLYFGSTSGELHEYIFHVGVRLFKWHQSAMSVWE